MEVAAPRAPSKGIETAIVVTMYVVAPALQPPAPPRRALRLLLQLVQVIDAGLQPPAPPRRALRLGRLVQSSRQFCERCSPPRPLEGH